MNNTLELAVADLELKIKGIITDTVNLPVTIRNQSNQKPATPYVELYFNEYSEVGKGVVNSKAGDYDTTSKEYEVYVEITCYRTKDPSITLSNILNILSTSRASYFKHFDDQQASFLRASSIIRRDIPIDKVQIEQRSRMTCVFSIVVNEKVETVADLGIKTVKFGTPTNGGVIVHAETDLKWYQEISY
jgi:hypothetical protein